MPRLDLLLFHAYFLARDPHEQELMRPFPPLGLQYLTAYLRRAGWRSVDWFDTTFSAGPAALQARCAETDPRVVGLYGHTITRPTALEMIEVCRADGRRIIAGGPDPVQYLDEYLRGGVEVVVIGEGERTLADLMAHLRAHHWRWEPSELEKIPGIAFLRDDTVVRTPARPLIRPLDQLPWPARERRDQTAYFSAWRDRHGETAMSMVTSRGCPYHCTWCSKQVYGDTFRRRSVDDVLGELSSIRERWNPDQIWFADDLFTVGKAWVKRFCAAMVERDLSMPFYLIGRPETLTAELCASLARAGLTRMYLSAESGAQHVLDAMRKGDTVADIIRAARLLRAAGVEIGVFVMLGYPGETRRDVDATLRMLHAIEPDVTLLSVAHPMKGTAFHELVSDRVLGQGDGGRLRFEMDYPAPFYDLAQRMIWAETALVRRLRRGVYDAETVKLAVKTQVWRAGTRVLGASRPLDRP